MSHGSTVYNLRVVSGTSSFWEFLSGNSGKINFIYDFSCAIKLKYMYVQVGCSEISHLSNPFPCRLLCQEKKYYYCIAAP